MRYAVMLKNKGQWFRTGGVLEIAAPTYELASSALYSTGHNDVRFCDEFKKQKNGALVFGWNGDFDRGEIYKLVPLSEELQASDAIKPLNV